MEHELIELYLLVCRLYDKRPDLKYQRLNNFPVSDVKPDQTITVQEGKGITSSAIIVFAKPATMPSPQGSPAQSQPIPQQR